MGIVNISPVIVPILVFGVHLVLLKSILLKIVKIVLVVEGELVIVNVAGVVGIHVKARFGVDGEVGDRVEGIVHVERNHVGASEDVAKRENEIAIRRVDAVRVRHNTLKDFLDAVLSPQSGLVNLVDRLLIGSRSLKNRHTASQTLAVLLHDLIREGRSTLGKGKCPVVVDLIDNLIDELVSVVHKGDYTNLVTPVKPSKCDCG